MMPMVQLSGKYAKAMCQKNEFWHMAFAICDIMRSNVVFMAHYFNAF